MRSVAHFFLQFSRHPADQDRLHQAVQLNGIRPVFNAGEGIPVYIANGAAKLDRVAQRFIQLARQRHVARRSEQVARDRLRCEECADLEQLQGRLVSLGQAVQRNIPRGGDRQRVIRGRSNVQQFGSLFLYELQVFARSHTGRRAPGRRLLDGQRKIAQRFGQLIGFDVRQIRRTSTEQFLAFLAGENVYRKGVGNSVPLWVPGGNEDLARASGGEEGTNRADILGVVEHDEPVTVRPARAKSLGYRGHRDVGFAADVETETLRERSEGGKNLPGLLGRNPPDHFVFMGVPVNVFDGDLGFPNPR